MDLPSLGLKDHRTLVFLGAGATRGSTQVRSNWLPPPIDTDFFRILQRSKMGDTPEGKLLLDHVRRTYREDLGVRMEAVFSDLQAAEELTQVLDQERGEFLRDKHRAAWKALNVVIPGLFDETVPDSCGIHRQIARRLKPGDVVISLNYDCIMDAALATHGNRFFDPRVSYGVEIKTGAEFWRQNFVYGEGGQHTSLADFDDPVDEPTLLLKLHGSLNWDFEDNNVILRKDPYQTPVHKRAIIPRLVVNL